DIWREGDDKLILEQKRVWRDFFYMVDCGITTIRRKLSRDPKSISRLNLGPKFESLDMKSCWNAKVTSTIKTVDKTISSKSLDFSSMSKYFTTTAKS
ncbi:Hypothetical predicted protein, partial [Olea europaea subsp. europaea]